MRTTLGILVIALGGWTWSCPPKPAPTPEPSPRPSPTLTPSSRPVPASTATPSPTPRYLPTLATVCQGPEHQSQYIGVVRQAMQQYQDSHPGQFDGSYFKYPLSQDVFFWGIADLLAGHGLDLVIDPCLCGDVQVSAHGTPLGMGFQEGYHPLSSARYVQAAPYTGVCEPKWVAYEGGGIAQ